jgi:hypothetical protein
MHVHSLLIILLPLTVLPLVTLAAPAVKRDTAPIYDGSQVNGKTYDYVVVGGGLTGVVLAARLTEDSGRTVLVVEAGYNEEANSVVTGECDDLLSVTPDGADGRCCQLSTGV